MPEWETAEDDWDKPCTLEDWQRVIDNNLTSAFLFAQAVGPHMMRQKRGKVVITSATGAEQGFPYLSAYCVSKAGLSELTRCLAAEWGPFNINVNAIAPGMIRTSMIQPWIQGDKMTRDLLKRIPLGRLGESRDIALLVLFLASEASDYISGQVFTIDGGAMGQGCGI